MDSPGRRTVTLVVEGDRAPLRAHALVDRLCDAGWLGSSRRAELRRLAGGASACPRVGDTSEAVVRQARAILHDHVERVADLLRRALDGLVDEQAYRIERLGQAVRIDVTGDDDAADVALVTALQSFGAGELFASAFLVESGRPPALEPTGAW